MTKQGRARDMGMGGGPVGELGHIGCGGHARGILSIIHCAYDSHSHTHDAHDYYSHIHQSDYALFEL
jgi:hypothetical protein